MRPLPRLPTYPKFPCPPQCAAASLCNESALNDIAGPRSTREQRRGKLRPVGDGALSERRSRGPCALPAGLLPLTGGPTMGRCDPPAAAAKQLSPAKLIVITSLSPPLPHASPRLPIARARELLNATLLPSRSTRTKHESAILCRRNSLRPVAPKESRRCRFESPPCPLYSDASLGRTPDIVKLAAIYSSSPLPPSIPR